MKAATFDPAKECKLYFRCNRAGSKDFIFVYSDGTPYSFVYQEFAANIYRYEGEKKVFIALVLAYNSNRLTVSITKELSNVDQGEYYFELYNANTEQTWISTMCEFHNGRFDGVSSDTETLTVNTEGEVIEITVQTSSQSVTLASLGTTLQTAATDTPLDADTWNFYDAVDAVLKKISWANIKATLKTYFDTLYNVVLSNGSGTVINGNKVDLGGTITGATTIDQGSNELTFSGTKTSGDQFSISRTHATGSGISSFNGTLSIEGNVAGGGGFYSALIFKQQWTPETGARQYNVITVTGNINVAGGITVTSAPAIINLRPDINITSGSLATLSGFVWNPTYTSGAPVAEYALMINSGLSKFGSISTAVPTARVHIDAGIETRAPLKLTTGTALTTPEDGAVEYHDSHLYFTIGSTRYQLDQQLSSVVWGAITGALSDQTDLQAALDAKEALSNKVGTVAASATQYPNNNAVIAYAEPLSHHSIVTTISTNNNVVANTLQDATGYLIPLLNGQTCAFKFVVPVTTQAGANGYRFTLTGPTFSSLNFVSRWATGSTGQSINYLSGYNLPAASAGTSGVVGVAEIYGAITATADGTLQLQFASEASGSATVCQAGGTIDYKIA